MTNRDELRALAQNTLDICDDGCYLYNKEKIVLPPLGRTWYYDNKFDYKKNIENKKIFESTEITVYEESTIDAIHRNANDKHLGILNFASARHAGGGFLNGAMAQEECLAYCSDLYDTQTCDIGKKYYENNATVKHHSYYNGMMMTENCFFRDSSFKLVKNPTCCMVITAPAVNMGQVRKFNEPEKSAKQTMKNRMRNILYLFIYHRCTNIILGAFGCGVFQNDPNDIARCWYELLVEEDLKKYFEKITFSILNSRTGDNITPFKKYF